MQSDGNLVVYDTDGVPLVVGYPTATSAQAPFYRTMACSSSTAPQGHRSGAAAAVVAAGEAVPGGSNVLCGEQWLNVDDSLYSANGAFRLSYQDDGNLVVYTSDGTPVWGSGTQGTSPNNAKMQADGNFVIYDPDGIRCGGQEPTATMVRISCSKTMDDWSFTVQTGVPCGQTADLADRPRRLARRVVKRPCVGSDAALDVRDPRRTGWRQRADAGHRPAAASWAAHSLHHRWLADRLRIPGTLGAAPRT